MVKYNWNLIEFDHFQECTCCFVNVVTGFQLYPDCFVFRHLKILNFTAFIHGSCELAGPKFLGAAWQHPQLNIFERGLLIEVYVDRGVGEFEVMTGVAVGKEIDDDLDINVCDACFAPDYQLHIENPMKNLNTDVDIAKIKRKRTWRRNKNQLILTGSASYESDSDEDKIFLG
ncbi:hypothetical protein YC2023_101588 [Brassica napus]|uniref:(rape) hypothetical protein n=1 Tax=Brassica napus TaxID=3708 RepID=A0A816UGZ5_BRANA|nr:unnamed protein product [Brassica napus]